MCKLFLAVGPRRSRREAGTGQQDVTADAWQRTFLLVSLPLGCSAPLCSWAWGHPQFGRVLGCVASGCRVSRLCVPDTGDQGTAALGPAAGGRSQGALYLPALARSWLPWPRVQTRLNPRAGTKEAQATRTPSRAAGVGRTRGCPSPEPCTSCASGNLLVILAIDFFFK